MSSDNGYIIRKHPDGGFCAVGYSMSVEMENGYHTPDGYPYPRGNETQFKTIKEAFDACDTADFFDGFYSEYGAHLDAECLKIQKQLCNELHEQVVNNPADSAGATCSCGKLCSSTDQLYKHQAESLREQLKQLQ